MTAVDEATMTGAVLAALGQIRCGHCDPEAGFAELGFDSLDRLALAVALEHRLGQAVPDAVLALAFSPADLARRLTCDQPQVTLAPATMAADAGIAEPAADPEMEVAGPVPADLGPGWVDPGGAAGPGTRLWHQAQIASGARVGAGCTLGKGAYIGSGSRIGDRVKVGNYASVFGASIEDEAMICPGALLLEDPAPRSLTPGGQRKGAGDFTCRPVVVGRGATVGAGAVLAPGVTVGPHALIGVGAVVLRDVPAHAVVLGNPARVIGWACRCGHRLDETLHCTACSLAYRQEKGTVSAPRPPTQE